jgi:hypothetical protein
MIEEIQTDNSASYIIHEPRAVAAGRGAGWLIDGYYRRASRQWLSFCIVGLLIMVGLGLVPFLGLLNGVLGPVWSAGVLLGCRDLHEGKALQVRHLFAGFGHKVGPLILSGILVSCLSFAIALLVFGPLAFQLMSGNNEALLNPDYVNLTLRILLMLVLMILVYAAAWFAPALIVLGNTGVVEALRLSLVAGLRNMGPLLVYGLMGIVLMIPVALSLGLAMLVVGPMYFASMFISFREIFVEEERREEFM